MDNTHFEQIWLLSSKNMEELNKASQFTEELCLNRHNSEPIDILRKDLNPIYHGNGIISLGSFFFDILESTSRPLIKGPTYTHTIAQFKKYINENSCVSKIYKLDKQNIFITKSFDDTQIVKHKIKDLKEYWILAYLQTICVYLKNENKDLDISKIKFNFILHDKDFNKEMNGKIGVNELEFKSDYLKHTDFGDVKTALNEIWGFQHTHSDYIFDDIIANQDFFKKESLNGKTAHEKLLEVLNIENRVAEFFNSLN